MIPVVFKRFWILIVFSLCSLLTRQAAASFSTATFESGVVSVGSFTSIAIDGAGNIHISYYEGFAGDLKYGKWNGTSWSTTTVDAPGDVGQYSSIAIDPFNNPHISYWDASNLELKYASYTGTSWNNYALDPIGGTGLWTSIAVDFNGKPHIAYYFKNPDKNLKYAVVQGTFANLTTVDSGGDVGEYTSIAIDVLGNPHIAYYDASNFDLRYSSYNGTSWSTNTVDSGGNVGQYTSIALNGVGSPIIAYYGVTTGDLKIASKTAGGWDIQTVDSGGNVGQYTALALDGSGNPHIAYYDVDNADLKYSSWTGTAWFSGTLDAVGNVGQWNTIAMDKNGRSHIFYFDETNFDLKYASWTAAGAAAPMGGNARGRVQAPSAFTAIALSSSNLKMEWADNSSNETAYRLFGTTLSVPTPPPPPASINSLVNSFNPGTTSFAEILVQDATYFRYIAAVNAGGIMVSSAVVVRMPDTTPPSRSSSFCATCRVGSKYVSLYWCPPGDDGTAGTLTSGSKFLVQHTTSPLTVEWSTANAQIDISAEGKSFDPTCTGCDSSALVSTANVVVNSTEPFFFRHWTRDEAGNYSLWFAATLYTIVTDFSTTENIEGDTSLHVGSFTSIAADVSGNLHVSYFDGSNHTLKYAKKSGGTWATQTVDSSGHVGRYTSLAVDAAGNPHIAYFDRGTFELKYAKWTGSAWSIERADIAGVVGEYASLALDGMGFAHISYYDNVFGDLKYARWNGVAWSTAVLDSGGNVGQYTSIAVDAVGNPHIAYYDVDNGDLKYASMTATGWNLQVVDSAGNVGQYTSIALDGSGYPYISYTDVTNGTLDYARWMGSSWLLQRVSTENAGIQATSIALDGDAKPYISYYGEGGTELYYAKWNGVLWSTQPAAPCTDAHLYNSLTIDKDGNPQIAFFDSVYISLVPSEVRRQRLRLSYLTSENYARPMGGNARGKVQAPTALSAVGRDTSAITWAWTDNSSNETGFRLYGATSTVGPFSLIAGSATLTAGTTAYSESNLSPDLNYYRYVAAVNAGGLVTSSYAVSSPIESKFPNAISNLTALQGPTTGQLTLTWTSPGDDGTNGNIVGGLYRIKYSDLGVITSPTFDSFSNTIEITTNTIPGQTVATVISGLSSGVTYYFAIKVKDDSGNFSLWNSSVDVATVNTLNWNWPTGIPPPQTNLTTSSTSVSRCSLAFSWPSVGSSTTYTAALSSMSNFSVLIQTGSQTGNTTTYSSGLSAGATYYFRVKVSTEVDAAYSSIISAVTLPEIETFVSTGGVYDVGDSNIQIPAGAAVTVSITCTGTGYHLITSTEVMTVTYSNGFSVSFPPGVKVDITPTASGLTITSTAAVTIAFEGMTFTPSSGTTAVSAGSPINIFLDTRTVQNLPLSIPANFARDIVANLTHPLGALKIEFPAGTFTDALNIVAKLPDTLPSQTLGAGGTRVRGQGMGLEVNLNKSLTPAKSSVITMNYNNISETNPSILTIGRFDEVNNLWVLLPAKLNRDSKTVTVQTPHFSKFQLLSVLPADNVSNAIAYPNPFRFHLGHDKMVFTNMSANASIKIYTYLGELVTELKADDRGQSDWLGTNKEGEKVMSGVYIALVEGAGKSQKILKIAVER